MSKSCSVPFVIILLTILTIGIVTVGGAQQKAPDAAAQIQPLPKGVSIHQLNNGMKVLLIENPALPMVGVNVAVRVGSAYENFSTSGMSHMLEHLLFNGTTHRDQKQLYDDVDRIGGYNNAHTDVFYTGYMMVMPTENTRKGMEIQADMLFNSTLPVDKFKKEQGIVLEEISKSLVNPTEQLEWHTLSVLYAGHAMSLPTLGTYATIESMTRDGVNAFYKNYYVPNNMIMNVVGNFQTNAMLAMIKEIYGKASPGQVTRTQDPDWATGYQIPTTTTGATPAVYHFDYDGVDRVLQVFYPLPANATNEYQQLLSLVMEKNKDATQTAMKGEFPGGVKSVKFSTRSTYLGTCLEAIVLLNNDPDYNAVVASLSKKVGAVVFKLPTETVKSEMTKARTEFVKNIEKPHMFGIYYSGEIVNSGFESLLASFTGTDFLKAAKDLESLKIGSPSTVILHKPTPKKDKEKSDAATTTKIFKDEKSRKNLIVVQNEASNLLAIHYLVKHKAVYESQFGKDASKILHDCLGERLKSDANQKLSSQYGLTFTVNDNPFIPMDDIYLHPDFGYIRVEGLADDVAGAIKYLNAQFKDFKPTEAEFNKSVEKFKGIEMMMMGGDKVKKAFDQAYRTALYEPDPYAPKMPALTYENLLAFAKEYFVPSNMVISVVSPLPADSINALLDIPQGAGTTNEPAVFTPTFLTQTKPVKVEQTVGGERAYLAWGFVKTIDPKDAPALQALSLVLSDDIVFDIREKQGMAYNMSAGIEVINDKAFFFISQGTRPQNVDKLVPQYPRFFQMSAVDSLTPAKLEKSINMYLGRMMFRRLSSINQAFYLGSSVYFFNDYNHDKQFLEDLKAVKAGDVVTVARKYMKAENPILIVAK
jgi:zinc protease